jgi:hypothetical protein
VSIFYELNIFKRLKKLKLQQDAILIQLYEIKQEMINMGVQLDNLTAAVNAEDSVVDGVVTLLQGIITQLVDLKQQLAEAGMDVAKLDALTADIQAHTNALSAAVANVPAN